jgi:hypothetical protein
MAYSAIIIDNFYDNPDDVRAFALQQDFNVDGNYPGHRTQAFLSPSIKNWIAHHLKGVHGEPIWPQEGKEEYCGAFQYTTAADRTWIHCDGWNDWAGVCYLTPDAPVTGGTGIYRHKETGLISCPRLANGEKDFELLDKLNKDGQDYTKWELVDTIGNVYNRLVLYPGDLFHASLDYFGKDLETGRLFQTFFFNTEN